MQPVNNATQPWLPTPSTSAANDRSGTLPAHPDLILLDMANREMHQDRPQTLVHDLSPPQRDAESAPAGISSPGRGSTKGLSDATDKSMHEGATAGRPSSTMSEQSSDAMAVTTTPAAPSTQVVTMPSWLNADGTLNEELPVEDLFRHVMENDVGAETLRAFATLYGEDRYQEEAGQIYDSSDAYYTCKDLRRSGYYVDVDHDDLMCDAKEIFIDTHYEWNDQVISSVLEKLEELKQARNGNIADALEDLQSATYQAIRGEALIVMEKLARARAE